MDKKSRNKVLLVIFIVFLYFGDLAINPFLKLYLPNGISNEEIKIYSKSIIYIVAILFNLYFVWIIFHKGNRKEKFLIAILFVFSISMMAYLIIDNLRLLGMI